MNNDDVDALHGQDFSPGRAGQFPYVVIRHFAATYEWIPVRFVEDATGLSQSGDTLLVPVGDSESEASDHSRAVLVERLVDLSGSTTRRTCAVFGPDDAVYVEPDGDIRASCDIPRGGFGEPC